MSRVSRQSRIDKAVWLTKWAASVIIVLAVSFRSAGEEYHALDMWLSMTGACLWLIVSIAWKDRALIMLNSVMVLTLLRGIIQL